MTTELCERVLKLAREYENCETKDSILAELLISTIDSFQQLMDSCNSATSFNTNAWKRAEQRLMAWFGLAPSPSPPSTK